MVRANWLATLLALVVGLFSGLPGGMLKGDSEGVAYSTSTGRSGASYGDLSKTVIGRVSQSDFVVLSRLITAEAGGEPYQGKVAVGASVLNRVRSGRFPSTIPGVVYQVSDGHYQYSPVLDGQINQPATAEAEKAAWAALAGADPAQGALHFYNPSKTRDQWVRAQKEITRIGSHVFLS